MWPDFSFLLWDACRVQNPAAGHPVGTLTISTWPQIIRLRFLVKVPTKSTSAGRKLGGPVRTRHCGLMGRRGQNLRVALPRGTEDVGFGLQLPHSVIHQH